MTPRPDRYACDDALSRAAIVRLIRRAIEGTAWTSRGLRVLTEAAWATGASRR